MRTPLGTAASISPDAPEARIAAIQRGPHAARQVLPQEAPSRRVRFRVERVVPTAPPSKVFATFRDLAPTLAERLPNLSRVEVLAREGERVRLKWYGKGDIPRAARALVKPEDLHWHDETEWDEKALEARVLITRPGMDFVRSRSTVRFDADGAGGTRIDVLGELTFDVPLIGGLLERAFVKHAEENLRLTLDIVADESA